MQKLVPARKRRRVAVHGSRRNPLESEKGKSLVDPVQRPGSR
jgi:hypothetical protein